MSLMSLETLKLNVKMSFFTLICIVIVIPVKIFSTVYSKLQAGSKIRWKNKGAENSLDTPKK